MALSALSATGNLILDPLYQLWYSLVAIIPSVILAILVLILGYCIAYLIGYIVRVGLERLGTEKYLKKTEFTKMYGKTHVCPLAGELIKWFVFIIFLQVAAEVLNLGGLSSLLDTFVRWLPHALVAVVVFFLGIALAHYLEIKIKAHSKMKGIHIAASVVKIVVLVIVVLIALRELGVNVSVLEYGFLLLLGALGLGVALALGIGLGLGLKKFAEDIIKDLRNNF